MRRRLRDRLKVPAIVLLVLNAGVYLAYTMPRSLRERNAAARASVLREEVELDRRVAAGLRARAEAMKSNRSDLERFYARLGPKATLLQVRAEITTVAKELGLRVGDLAYSREEVKGGEGVAQLQMRLGVSGTYRELAAFLDRLERSPYFVTVDQIQLRKKQTSGADLDIVLSSFYRAQPSPPGGETETP